MKKYLYSLPVVALAITLISWGFIGHKVTALIAEDFLTPQSKTAVKELLGNQSLADVASWADDVRNTAEYKYTAPYHFLNVELGMNYEQFSKTVKALSGDNIYTAIKKYESELKSPSTTKEEKVVALKFIVHFIGDTHQPMHISRAEDKGGNSIKVSFMDKETNLHSLWDSGLITHEGLTDDQLVAELKKELRPAPNNPTVQKDDLMHWLYDSYTVSSRLYAEVATNTNFGEDYYTAHIKQVHKALLLGGIRLAAVLNDVFKNGLVASAPSAVKVANPQVGADSEFAMSTPMKVDAKDLEKYVGKNIYTTGKIVSGRLIESNGMTLLNVNGENPNQDFTIMIKSENRSKFGQPEVTLKGKDVAVQGYVIDYRGKPEVELLIKEQLQILN